MAVLDLKLFNDTIIDITNPMLYAMHLCKDAANYDLDCANILDKLLNASNSKKYSVTQQNYYLNLAMECLKLFSNINIPPITLSIEDKHALIKTYILGCREDAANTKKLEEIFKGLAYNTSRINLDFLATLLYALENKLLHFKTFCRPISDLELLERLIEIIKSLIFSSPDLVKLYCLCKNHLQVEYISPSIMSYKFNEKMLHDFLKGLEKIYLRISKIATEIENNLLNFAKVIEAPTTSPFFTQALDEFKNNYLSKIEHFLLNGDYNTQSNTIVLKELLMPSVFELNTGNYRNYNFSIFYELTYYYKNLSNTLSTIKKCITEQLKQEALKESEKYAFLELEQEAQNLMQEAQELIFNAKNLTTEHRNVANKLCNITPINIPDDFQEKKDWKQVLSLVNKNSLKYLECLFDFNEKTHLKFSEVTSMITALGGKIATYDGSKTRILLPGTYSIKINHVKTVGGLHKPHNDDLRWVHARLIVKALERAGLTKKIFQEYLSSNKKNTDNSKMLKFKL